VVVAATGNDGKANIAAPSSCAGVIAVTAHTVEGDNADYANIGDSGDGTASKSATNATTISAPGGGSCAQSSACSDNYVWSTVNRGATDPDTTTSGQTYGGSAGTSMATPHVAAAAALLIAMDPGLNSDRVQSVLTATARAFPANTYCAGSSPGANKCGAGMLDVAAAVTELQLRLPTVNAGAAQSADTGTTATLAGTASVGSHSAGSSLTYQWTQIGGAAVSLATPKAATTTFTAPATPDTLTFKLTVTDSRGYTGSASTSVTVTAAPAGGGGGGGGGAVDGLALLALGALAAFSGLSRRRVPRRG
jgi:serine protease